MKLLSMAEVVPVVSESSTSSTVLESSSFSLECREEFLLPFLSLDEILSVASLARVCLVEHDDVDVLAV